MKTATPAEGTVLDIELPKTTRKRFVVERSGFVGMWKDRKDIKDGVSYEDHLRQQPRT